MTAEVETAQFLWAAMVAAALLAGPRRPTPPEANDRGVMGAPHLNNASAQCMRIDQVEPGIHLAVDGGDGPQAFLVD
jgi:hypothetical protein